MADVVTNFPRESTLARIADALERQHTQQVLAQLDGTEATYRRCMRGWFLYRGAETATPEELTALCEEWYAATRTTTTWCGGTEFYQPDVSAVTTGERVGDNVGMSCIPSTDIVAGQDDYAGEPLFVPTDVNWMLDSDGNRLVTAIEGITSGFRRRDTGAYVGVMQMAPWVWEYENATVYARGVAAQRSVGYDVEPVAEAVKPDGTLSEFVLHGKYVARKLADGSLACCAGYIPTAWMSHNAVRTASHVNGSAYSGECACDVSWLHLMMHVKYASLTLDGIIQGCCNANYQYPALVSETGVRRVLVTPSQGANLDVGMSVLVGTCSATSTDRNTASMYSATGQAGALVTAVEPVSVDGVEYAAVYVGTAEPFDTAANGAAVEGTTYISSFHWTTGKTDCVRGNDGSPVSCTSGKYPAKLQGIEFMVGAYEVLGDVILYETAEEYQLHTCRESAKQSTALTADYIDTGLRCAKPATAAWGYIKKQARAMGATLPCEVGGSSSTYTRDAFYQDAQATANVTREYLAFGLLGFGSGSAGLSCLYGPNALSSASWLFASRLSPNANRGEYDAIAA